MLPGLFSLFSVLFTVNDVTEVQISVQPLSVPNQHNFTAVSADPYDTLIPPSVLWTTFLGGNLSDEGRAIARDAAGNIYIAGEARSSTGLALHGHDNSIGERGNGFLAKYSADGHKIWATYFGGSVGRDFCNAVAVDNNGNIVITGFTYSYQHDLDFNGFQQNYGGDLADAFVARFNSAGTLLWSSYLGGPDVDSGLGIDTDNDGNIYVTGITWSTSGIAAVGPDLTINGYYDAFLTKISPTGTRLWSTYVGGESGDRGNSVVVDSEGDILLSGDTGSQTGIATSGRDVTNDHGDAFMMKFNPQGQRIWGTYFGGNSVEEFIFLALDKDDNIFLSGTTYSWTGLAHEGDDETHNGYHDAFLAKFDPEANLQWSTYLGGDDGEEIFDVSVNETGDVYIAGKTWSTDWIPEKALYNSFIEADNIISGMVARYTSEGQLAWSSFYPGIIYGVEPDNEFGVFLTGYTTLEIAQNGENEIMEGGSEPFLSKLDDSGRMRAGYIIGTIFEDHNNNCVQDNGEQPLSGIVLTTEPGDYFARTDSAGRYTLWVDTGTYVVKQSLSVIQQSALEQTCPVPTLQPVTVENYYDTVQYDIGNRLTACPQLAVQVISGDKARCFRGNTFITYQNEGYAVAENVELHVKLPEHLLFVEANRSYTTSNDGILTFPIGTLLPGENGRILLTDSVSCHDVGLLGLTQCTKAWLTPASTCGIPDPAWDKSDITVYGKCVDDGVGKILLYNKGEQDMADSALLKVYLDDELAWNTNYKINRNDSLVLRIPAAGKTIYVVADERPGHPFNRQETAVLEGCGVNPMGNFSTGFVNQVNGSNGMPSESQDCRLITGSFDPNDKRVVPEGVTSEAFVHPDAELTYTIRFENKGNGPAVNIIVIDTLDANLDPATLRGVTASHAFSFTMTGQGRPVLTWRFANIYLPPAEQSELLSQGFISFRIRAHTGLADKTVVENEADIFFDFNEPIRTNKTKSVLHEYSPEPVPGVLEDEIIILPRPDIKHVLQGNGEGQLIVQGSGFDPVALGNTVTVNEEMATVTQASSTELIISLTGTSASGMVTIRTEAGEDSYDFIITGAEDPFAQNVHVYPNPSTGIVRVRLSNTQGLRQVSVIDSQGAVVSVQNSFQTNDGIYDIVLPERRGMYVLKLLVDRKTLYRKVFRK